METNDVNLVKLGDNVTDSFPNKLIFIYGYKLLKTVENLKETINKLMFLFYGPLCMLPGSLRCLMTNILTNLLN